MRQGPSVKDVCRQDRGIVDEKGKYPKMGYQQKRPADLEGAIKSKKYLLTLLDFLASEWATARCADLLQGITAHFCYGPCYTYQVSFI